MKSLTLTLLLSFTCIVGQAEAGTTSNYYEEFKTGFENAADSPEITDFINSNSPSKSLHCYEAFETSPDELNESRFTLYDLGPGCQSDHDYRIEPGNGSGHEPSRPLSRWSANHKLMWTLEKNIDSYVIMLNPVYYKKFYPNLPSDTSVNLMWNTVKKSQDGNLYYQEVWKTPCGRLISMRYGKCEK